MFPAERRNQILKLVQERGRLSISELTEIFDVSEMTIHRDLVKLQETGVLEKSYGGVVAKNFSPLEPDFASRLRTRSTEKDAIARLAAAQVEEGDSIIVDGSTTVLALVRHLKSKRNLAVFTTGVMAEMELLGCENLTVYSTGGLLSPPTAVYVGPHTIEFLKSLHVDKYFVSANSFNVERGVTDPFMLEAEVKRQCALVADHVYLLVDYSKFGIASTMPSIPVSKLHLIITDSGCPTNYLEELDRAGLKYLVAPVSSSAD